MSTMDSENESQNGVRERSNGRNDGEIWGAKDSLRRNAGLNKTTLNEVTPLLGGGSGSSQDGEERMESGWAGHADFEGLSWRHKPSVRILMLVFEPS